MYTLLLAFALVAMWFYVRRVESDCNHPPVTAMERRIVRLEQRSAEHATALDGLESTVFRKALPYPKAHEVLSF